MKIFRELWWFFKQEKKSYITGIALLIIVAALELLPPKIIGLTVDGIKEGTLNGKRLMQMVGILLGA
ncbi:MAG: multidrug ABC transporter permease/ATP-binding protein, partial [Priestia megaterium]